MQQAERRRKYVIDGKCALRLLTCALAQTRDLLIEPCQVLLPDGIVRSLGDQCGDDALALYEGAQSVDRQSGRVATSVARTTTRDTSSVAVMASGDIRQPEGDALCCRGRVVARCRRTGAGAGLPRGTSNGSI